MNGDLRKLLAGFSLEKATVARVNSKSLTIARDGTYDYANERSVVLFFGGRFVIATVVSSSYNGSVTDVKLSRAFSGVPTVYYERLNYIPLDDEAFYNFDFSSTLVSGQGSKQSEAVSFTSGNTGNVSIGSADGPFGLNAITTTSANGFAVQTRPAGLSIPEYTWEFFVYGNNVGYLCGYSYMSDTLSPVSVASLSYTYLYNTGTRILWRAFRCNTSDGSNNNGGSLDSNNALVSGQWNHVSFGWYLNDAGSYGYPVLAVNGNASVGEALPIYMGALAYPIVSLGCVTDHYAGVNHHFMTANTRFANARASRVCRYKSNFTPPSVKFDFGLVA